MRGFFSWLIEMREPDRGQLDIFVDALFRHARQGYVSHRAFIEGTTKVFRITPSALTGGLSFVADVAEDDARRAANNPQPAVFCPPICTFTDDKRAAEKNIAEGLALSVECDDHPAQALAILEDILGPPTVSVLSGGKYVESRHRRNRKQAPFALAAEHTGNRQRPHTPEGSAQAGDANGQRRRGQQSDMPPDALAGVMALQS
jgi:hypothetical protein